MRNTIRKYTDFFATPSDLTSGSVLRNVFVLSFPIVLTQFFQTAFNIVDTIFVGRLGSTALAAVGISGQILFLIITIIMGLAIGTSAMVARFVGAGDNDSAANVVVQSTFIGFFSSAFLAIIGIAYSKELLQLVGAKGEVLIEGMKYLQIILIAGIVMFLLFLLASILQGSGAAYTSLWILAISTVTNIILDPLMIYGIGFFPRMEVKGAALATVISRGLGVLIGIFVLMRGKSRIHVKSTHLKIDTGTMRQIVQIGVPSSIQMTVRSFVGVIIMRIVLSTYGKFIYAGYYVGMRVLMVALMPGFGIGRASGTLVGQNLGAEKPERSYQSAWTATMMYVVIMLFFSLAAFSFPSLLIKIFNTERLVVQAGANYLRIVSLSYIFVAVSIVLSKSMQGAGYTMVPMVITSITLIVIQIPLALWLPYILKIGVQGIWWAIVISYITQCILMTFWFQKGNWKLKKI